ncbi:unnamed protein product [Didymodactylos carnosus]|uniref:Uncharacterized protein n=1 Tax=Didymodactylos carnosus TaxID=1234261 RepID=A0A815ZLS8_9BILA|nr:unnamed protein product [Didymodactylos carnosus]CAF1584839.1 unnamed protein product [Didymodactylos carnosus]CAF4245561.1 unnamed protein product [Didymodactylos carnosus]CAF4453913.1 unnamed protein product [Didymodactylos carnosus]
MSIFNQKEITHKNLTSENGNFLWNQLYLEVLVRMPDYSIAKYDLVKMLKYKDDKLQLDIIREFDETYDPSKALFWYTKESCL